jgi:hypothetical protein
MTYPENPAVKLVIKKNRRVVGIDNHFSYLYEWYNNDNVLVLKEPRKVQADGLLLPDETIHDLEAHIAQKIQLGIVANRESLTIEEIDV